MRHHLFPALATLALCAAGAVRAQPATEYIWRTESVRNIAPAADDLRAELDALVLEMIGTGNPAIDNGQLQPALFRPGLAGEFLLYGAPSESVLLLSDILPLLSAPVRTQLASYLGVLLNTFPPLERSFVHGTGTWGWTLMERNRRESHPMPSTGVNIWPPPSIPLSALYALWRYADATGDWAYLRARLPALQALYNTYDGTPSYYGEVLGLIGAARIAEHEGLRAWRDDAVTRATAAIAAADYVAWVNARQTELTRSEHDWCYPVFHEYRAEPAVAVAFGPEIGRLIADRSAAAAIAHVSPRIGGPGRNNHGRASQPGWMGPRLQYCDAGYIYKGGEIPNWANDWQGGENAYNTPDFAWTFFLLRAYVYGDSAEDLRTYIDAPMCIADLCHLHKLAVAIRAYGQRQWRSVRGGNLDNDVDVDLGDVTTLLRDCWTGPEIPASGGCSEADLDGDLDVDLADFALVQRSFTGPR